MPDPVITLTTDFGEESPYVAAMKGVILAISPAARLLDLSHRIPPQDVRHAAYFLSAAVPYFPPSVIHVVVVDPGVGTSRAILYVEIDGHRLLVPDNGCWTLLPCLHGSPPAVYRLSESRYWRRPVSATFHGRDILAPVAGHLSVGVPPEELAIPVADWVRLREPSPRLEPGHLAGEVVFVDRFGNLITNIPGEAFEALPGSDVRITVGGQTVDRRVRTYGEAAPGTLLALISSTGRLEVAVTQGSAVERLHARVGTPVTVESIHR